MKAEIISIGRELLMGETADTNSNFLAKQMPMLGIELVRVTQVGDVQSEIVEVLRGAWERSDLVLLTGGLGPTGDDLTRESIAETMGEAMAVVPELAEALRQRFSRMGMNRMPESNLKQCTLIPCAVAIPNAQGTAPGWWIEKDGRILVCMPGPPREMYEMWDKHVLPRLQQKSEFVIMAKTWKTYGYNEATVGELTFPLFKTDNPSLGVYARPDGIHVQLKVTAKTQADARTLLADGEARIKAALDGYIWGSDEETIEETIGKMLTNKNLSLAVMEDYSGGLLTSSLMEVLDGDAFFKGGLVARSNEAKIALGVPSGVLTNNGPFDEKVAAAMAEAARKHLNAYIGVGVGGMEPASQPNGEMHIAIAGATIHKALIRPRNKQRLVPAILFELRRFLVQS